MYELYQHKENNELVLIEIINCHILRSNNLFSHCLCNDRQNNYMCIKIANELNVITIEKEGRCINQYVRIL
jgi:hypothetical protein